MPDADASRLIVDPPIASWRLRSQGDAYSRAELAPVLDTLGLHDTPFNPARELIFTGHQAWFWHPGILAKDLAMAVACAGHEALAVHLVVDHIANPALTIDVPVRRGDAVEAVPLRLGREDLAIGTGSRPPLTAAGLRKAVASFEMRIDGEVLADLSALTDTPPGFDALGSLAESITAMQLWAVRDECPRVYVLRTSRLARLASFEALVLGMLHDARWCVTAYNDAVAAVPEAGVAPLLVERDRVELPLWVIETNGSLGRVFADLADAQPILTREDGMAIEPVATDDGTPYLPLAPKALTLTAYVRSTLAGLFIHGTGGRVYERVTERWWQRWLGAALAPLAVVSADLTLDLGMPTATARDLDRAVWFRHHLPHNIDRHVDASSLDPALLAEKRAILAGDPADHGKPSRLAARRRLNAINAAFANAHPALLTEADAAVARARRGVANAAVAARRDWCFQLYPPDGLARLRQTLVDSA